MTLTAVCSLSDRVMRWADALAVHTEGNGLTCTYMTPVHTAVRTQLRAWMHECGFDEVRVDAVGNVIGRYHADPTIKSPRIVALGSHYDTVRNGGRYDGRLGILVPLALVADLHAEARRLPYDLEVICFSEEEGVRFGTTFIGSTAYAGRFDLSSLSRCDRDGVPLRQALRDAGFEPNEIAQAATETQRLHHYAEIHIEQGPVLLDQDLAVGVVSGIAGNIRRRLGLVGRSDHAGTTPMHMRRDAAAAAAEIILAVERRCTGTPGLVGTVGMVDVPGGAINVVPGHCELSVDVRAGDDALRDAAMQDIDAEIEAICRRRDIGLTQVELMRVPAVPCSDVGRALWRGVVEQMNLPVVELPSGAGHDAMVMAAVAPMSMLFVRCGNGGISHHPDEIVAVDDVQVAIEATRQFLFAVAPL